MKKSVLPFLALCFLELFSLAISSCVSSRAPSNNGETVNVGGLLQTNDNKSYFIILGAETKSARTFFFVKDAKRADAWKTLAASVGQTIFVRGRVIEDGGPWLKTVAVQNVSLSEEI